MSSSTDEYRDYPFQPPTLTIKNDKEETYQAYYSLNESQDEKYDDKLIQTYIENLTYIEENLLSNKHLYNVNFEYNWRGIINQITIEY